jgi:hypothetical protein
VTGSADDFEVLAAIEGLFKLATSNKLNDRIGEPANAIRARATLARALFIPNEQARRNLVTLAKSEDMPEELRSVAPEALTDWTS